MKKLILVIISVILIISLMGCNKKSTVNHYNILENPQADINKSFEYHGMFDRFRNGTGRFIENNIINYENPPIDGFIIRSKVKILADANDNSIVLGLLNLHDRIEILDEVSILQIDPPFNNWSKNWYKITFNSIDGYIRTCCADKQKYLFNIKGNSIIIYPHLANGMFDDRDHNPNNLINRARSHNIIINNQIIQLPNSYIRGYLKGGEVIDGNLHLIYNYSFDESNNNDGRIIISAERNKIYIGTKDSRTILHYVR
ncbi:MAG: hypothetical protein FWD13_06985 [Treponema sp.]|nr:hypothetical protein [Treponema sp.]